MTESADLDRMEQAVRAAAEACGAMVIEAVRLLSHPPASRSTALPSLAS